MTVAGGTHKRRAPMIALFVANAISLTGNRLAILAVPWFVLQTTGSASKTGLTAFFTILPVVISSFFGGAVVDRLGYKRTSVLSDIASGIAVAMIPLLAAAGLLPFPMLLALVFLGALLDAPGGTARVALLPDVAALAGTRLERATAFSSAIQRGSQLLGAPLAGLLIAVLGPVNALWLDAATFAVSAALVAVAIPSPVRDAIGEEARDGYISDLMVGLRFIRRDRLILALVLTVMFTNFLDAAESGVVLPVYVSEVYESAIALGLLFGASGGGALAGAVAYGAIGHKLRRRPVFTAAFIVSGLPLFVMATLPPLPVAFLAQFFGGLAAGPINPLLNVVLFGRVSADMRGRVFGTLVPGAFVAMPMGGLVAGYVLEGIGVRLTLLAGGVLYLLATLSLIFNPAIQELDSAVTPVERSDAHLREAAA